MLGAFLASICSPCALPLTGSLTTPFARAVHAEAFAVQSGRSNATVDRSNASELDAAFIRTPIAANRFAGQCGKTFALASPPAGPLGDAVRRCGFRTPKRPSSALAEIVSDPST
jgi:hypothetical protein